MINDLDRTIQALLTQELNIDNGSVEISFGAPNSEWVSRLGNTPALNLFLYDVRENAALRHHQWQQLTTSPAAARQKQNGSEPPLDLRRMSTAFLKRTPLMIDCFYMVSAWSPADSRTGPTEEHWLLSLCMKALARHPTLNPERTEEAESVTMAGRNLAPDNRTPATNYLVGALANQEVEIRTRLAHHDVLTNPAEVWSALENQMKAAFSYVVTLPLDPWDESIQQAERVGLSTFTARQKPRPAVGNDEVDDQVTTDGTDLRPAGPSSGTLYRLAGAVWNVAVTPADPASGLQVVIMDPSLLAGTKNLGLYRRSRTDSQGRFSFQRLLPGEYVILVGPDIESPLATENVVIAVNTNERPEDGGSNILIDIEVHLP